MWQLVYVFLFSFSLLITAAITRAAIGAADVFSMLDHPGERKVQSRPMPLLGGVAIFLGFSFTILINLIAIYEILPRIPFLFPQDVVDAVPGVSKVLNKFFGILIGGTFIFLLGLVDDRMGISPGRKLLGQVMGALILFYYGVRVTMFSGNLFFCGFITVFWVLAVINAFNLLDNMDGLAAGVAFIACSVFLTVSIGLGQLFVSALLVVLMGSLLGFLLFNFPPARIYMGDSGSMFLGYMIATVTILGTYYFPGSPTIFAIVMPVLILAVPFYDTVSVICIRIKSGQPVYMGDRNHFSHRLVRLGMSERGTILFIYLVAFTIGLSALLLNKVGFEGVFLIFFQTAAILLIIAMMEYYGWKRGGE